MIVAFLIVAIGFILVAVTLHYEKRGDISPIPDWLILTVMLSLIVWMLYRALLTRPKCPNCKSGRTNRLDDYIEDIQGAKNPANWRRYQCSSCNSEFLVPELSLEG